MRDGKQGNQRDWVSVDSGQKHTLQRLPPFSIRGYTLFSPPTLQNNRAAKLTRTTLIAAFPLARLGSADQGAKSRKQRGQHDREETRRVHTPRPVLPVPRGPSRKLPSDRTHVPIGARDVFLCR